MGTDDDDKRVKDMLGSTSMADLQRWFGLPSFTQLAEEGKVAEVPEDPYKEARERIAKAIAAIEPWFLEGIFARHEKAQTLLTFKPTIDLRVRLDMEMIDQAAAVGRTAAEPREIERPADIEDDLRDRAPQALLRDLHRVESSFDKQYEVYDAEAMQPITVGREAAEMMATDLKLPPFDRPAGSNLAALMSDVVTERRRPWNELIQRNRMANRRIQE